ncbi:MAG: hypothetical protein PHY47_23870 [Lachnospiraceae bacterium]|nr:hypothetical protein [Lachnospiraceae bacterium]
MCYLIAKDFNEKGCYAVETERNKTLASLVSYLTDKTLSKNIQILTVSDRNAYGEYEPYNILDDESQFISKVLSM